MISDNNPTQSKTPPAQSRSSGLTSKQDDFCHHVAAGHNFSAAYRKAYDAEGMSASTVWGEAHKLARREKVSRRIAELVEERRFEDRLQTAVRAQRVTDFLDHVMENGKSETVRLRAAELLGKSVGLFNDPQEAPRLEPTIEELEAEVRRRLGGLKTVTAESESLPSE